ncbi:anti-sigma factor antagonist [Tannockella kyphosi]|uniref:anti-sigma factor antagonist n=1 Tax=Tannockella kyphosi TaxID=2899121 RepID=UPI002010DA5F|nr:anti-sigma factor antagonist [Tannockella kyphosi]
MENKLEYQYLNGDLIVYFIGELDGLVTPKYRYILDELLSNKKTNIIFDFKKTILVDSAGVGLLIGRYQQVKHTGHVCSIQNTSNVTYKLLDLSGIFKIMEYREEVKC